MDSIDLIAVRQRVFEKAGLIDLEFPYAALRRSTGIGGSQGSREESCMSQMASNGLRKLAFMAASRLVTLAAAGKGSQLHSVRHFFQRPRVVAKTRFGPERIDKS